MTKHLLEPQQQDHCVAYNIWYKNYSVTQQCFPTIIKMIIIYIPARQTGPKNQENARFSLLLLLLFWLPQWLSITLCQLLEDCRKVGAKVGLSFVLTDITLNRLKTDRPTYLGGAVSAMTLHSCCLALLGCQKLKDPGFLWLLLMFCPFGPIRPELDTDWRFKGDINDTQ